MMNKKHRFARKAWILCAAPILLLVIPVNAQLVTTNDDYCDQSQLRFTQSVLCDDPDFPQCTLIHAIQEHNVKLLGCILDRGFSPIVESGRFEGPQIPIFLASWEGDLDSMKLLLRHSGNSEITDKQFGMTALMWIIRFPPRNRETAFAALELLINSGANVNVRDLQGMTPLAMCSEDNDSECVRLLLSAGATPADEKVKPDNYRYLRSQRNP